MKIPLDFWIRLFVLVIVSANKTMFAGKNSWKKQENRQNWRNLGFVPKSHRVQYLDNKFTEGKNIYTIDLVSSKRIVWYATRLYSNIFEKWPCWPLTLKSDLLSNFFCLTLFSIQLLGGPINKMEPPELKSKEGGGRTKPPPSLRLLLSMKWNLHQGICQWYWLKLCYSISFC